MSNAVNDLETLANALGRPVDFEISQDELKVDSTLSQGKVKLENPPSTLAEAGELLSVKVSSTTVKTRIVLISDKCYIPIKYLALQDGNNRMTGLTALGWAILKDFPHEKGTAREQYLDMIDDRFSDYLPHIEEEVVEAEIEEEEITSADYSAIVQRKIDNLSLPVEDAITFQPMINFGDFSTLKQLARQAGRVMGQQLGAEVSLGMNEGMLSAQQSMRAGMLQSTEGL